MKWRYPSAENWLNGEMELGYGEAICSISRLCVAQGLYALSFVGWIWRDVDGRCYLVGGVAYLDRIGDMDDGGARVFLLFP